MLLKFTRAFLFLLIVMLGGERKVKLRQWYSIFFGPFLHCTYDVFYLRISCVTKDLQNVA